MVVAAERCQNPHWVSAWTASPSNAAQGLHIYGSQQTFREIVSPLGQGDVVRVRLSNRYGTKPAMFTAVTLAKQAEAASIVTGTSTAVLFNGQPSLEIAAGEEAISDPIRFKFASFEHFAVSMAVKNLGGSPTSHGDARQYSYLTLPLMGNHVNDIKGTAFVQRSNSRHYVISLDVLASAQTSAVVVLGSSTTNGAQMLKFGLTQTNTIGQDTRYPDFLKRNIDTKGLAVFVANAGISGNQVSGDPTFLTQSAGESAVNRLQQDVLTLNGVKTVIIFEGMNDILAGVLLNKSRLVIRDKIINGYQTLITTLKAKGDKVILATITPTGSSWIPTLRSAEATTLRQEINTWIRQSSAADAVADFDAAVRDSKNPNILAAAYDGGDGQHFSPEGNQRLADAVNLDWLQGSDCKAN